MDKTKVTVRDNYAVCVWIYANQGEAELRKYIRSLPEDESLAMESANLLEVMKVVSDE